MTMTLPTKLGVSFISLGSVAGIGYIGSTYLLKSDEVVSQTQEGTAISDLINKEFKYVLLNTSTTGVNDSSFWTTNWQNYNRENANSKSGEDPLKLAGWTPNNKTDLTAELKKECEKLSKKTVISNEDSDYQNVGKYCSRGVTVEEDAKSKRIEILDTKSSGGSDQIWTKRHENRSTLKSNLDKLGITGSDSEITKEKIRDGCGTAKSRNKKEEDYQAIYAAYVKICTKQAEDGK